MSQSVNARMGTSELAFAEMPSNIALIKYMGKIPGGDKNRPTNSSLSLTLPRLRSRVEIAPNSEKYDNWSTLEAEGWLPTQLSERGRKRFMAHFGFLKQKLGIQGHYFVRSANNFPSDCGIASSASSFAALTQATYELARRENPTLDWTQGKLAELSRVGSGSSIRSFLSPLVLWNSEGISNVETPYSQLEHQVFVVEKTKKAIGSSDAHERVTSSLLFQGRPQRAEKRLQDLLTAFNQLDWSMAFQIVWAEFWDMHALFQTANPSFGYMTDDSLKVLNAVADFWQKHGDGPLVTMDAGANVHFIYRADQLELKLEIQEKIKNLWSSSVVEII